MGGPDTTRLWSLKEAADRLGIKVKTLRGYVYRRKVPYVKIFSGVKISEETIQRIIDRGSMPAIEEGRARLRGLRK